jgi:hypothetical protein
MQLLTEYTWQSYNATAPTNQSLQPTTVTYYICAFAVLITHDIALTDHVL